jgi:aspartyl aminopeptidase
LARYTWFDRDLGVSGRVLLDEHDGRVTQRLVQIKRPIYRVPSLAIHLNRSSGAVVGAGAVGDAVITLRNCNTSLGRSTATASK